MEEITLNLYLENFSKENLRDLVKEGMRFFLANSITEFQEHSQTFQTDYEQGFSGYLIPNISIKPYLYENQWKPITFDSQAIARPCNIEDENARDIVYLAEDNALTPYKKILTQLIRRDAILPLKKILIIHDHEAQNSFVDYMKYYTKDDYMKTIYGSIWDSIE